VTARVLSLAVLISLAAPITAAEPTLAVGFAEVDVSPTLGKKPVYLAGFGQDRKATKIHDPIMARAVVFSDGTQKIAFASIDIVGLFIENVTNIRKELPGFRYVLVSSTHNHEGPDTLGLWGPNQLSSGVDPEYMKRVEAGVAKAIRDAVKSLAPASAAIGTAKGPELLRDGRQPMVLHDDIVTIRFADKTGKAIGILVQWNCHPETLDDKNTEVSADYVAATVKALREKHRCPVAYFTGTVGGLLTSLGVPVKNAKGEELKDGTFEKTEEYGRLVAALADRALAKAVPAELVPFDVRAKPVLVPVDNAVYKIAKQIGKLKRPMYDWTGDPFLANPKESKDAAGDVAILSEIGLIRLGQLDVAAIPGEIYPELVLGRIQDPVDPGADFPDAPKEPAIYDQMTGKHKMIIGLANDELGYFIPKRQWDEKAPFCYGLKKSQYGEINSVGPRTSPILCEAFKTLAAPKGK
jgi:hypothetical protein